LGLKKSIGSSWSIVMTAFAESNRVNQAESKINGYHATISLVCVVGAIVFLLAICFISTSPDRSPNELAMMAIPP
jgi:hypothetical protein